MPGKCIYLFATRADYEPVIREVESKHSLKYALCGLLEAPPTTCDASLMDIADLGLASNGISETGNNYIISDTSEAFKYEELLLKSGPNKGRLRYSIDERHNPDSISFLPGGLYQSQWLLRGYIATSSVDRSIITLYGSFVREFKKRFTRIRSAWLGLEAIALMDAGVCLTTSAHAPKEFCLQRTKDNSYW